MRFRGSLFTLILPASGSQARPCCCLHIYIPRSRTSARGGLIGSGLTDSRGSHLSALPSLNLCPYYSRFYSACQGLFGNFFAPLVSPVPRIPSGFSRPDSRALVLDLSPFHRGTAARHSSVAAPRRFVYRPSEPSRPARVVTRSRWNHPLSMVLLYHTLTGLSRVLGNFLESFLVVSVGWY